MIGTGDGTKARFALVKTYGEGEDAYQRLIARPVIETLRVAVDGIEKASPADWSFDFATGEVVFVLRQRSQREVRRLPPDTNSTCRCVSTPSASR